MTAVVVVDGRRAVVVRGRSVAAHVVAVAADRNRTSNIIHDQRRTSDTVLRRFDSTRRAFHRICWRRWRGMLECLMLNMFGTRKRRRQNRRMMNARIRGEQRNRVIGRRQLRYMQMSGVLVKVGIRRWQIECRRFVVI